MHTYVYKGSIYIKTTQAYFFTNLKLSCQSLNALINGIIFIIGSVYSDFFLFRNIKTFSILNILKLQFFFQAILVYQIFIYKIFVNSSNKGFFFVVSSVYKIYLNI